MLEPIHRISVNTIARNAASCHDTELYWGSITVGDFRKWCAILSKVWNKITQKLPSIYSVFAFLKKNHEGHHEGCRSVLTVWDFPLHCRTFTISGPDHRIPSSIYCNNPKKLHKFLKCLQGTVQLIHTALKLQAVLAPGLTSHILQTTILLNILQRSNEGSSNF